jgi:hypothetical protein
VFSLTVGVTPGKMTHTPDLHVFETAFADLQAKLDDAVAKQPPLLTEKCFVPFTQVTRIL